MMEKPKVIFNKGKKKDEVDRQKQAEKKRRRLEKALANSAAIISQLEKKKHKKKKKKKKKEEQQRLDDEPCRHFIRCNHSDSAGFDFALGAQGMEYPPDGADHVFAPKGKGRCTDWGIGQPLPSSWGEVQLQAPCYQGNTCPGFIAAQAVSSLQIGGDVITSPLQAKD